jgi:hypothetical protein
MKNLFKIREIFPNYRIFKSLSHPQRYYAVLDTDVEQIEKVRREFSDRGHHILDSLKVKALPLVTDDNDFLNDFDHHPTLHRINDLIEEVFTSQEAKL